MCCGIGMPPLPVRPVTGRVFTISWKYQSYELIYMRCFLKYFSGRVAVPVACGCKLCYFAYKYLRKY